MAATNPPRRLQKLRRHRAGPRHPRPPPWRRATQRRRHAELLLDPCGATVTIGDETLVIGGRITLSLKATKQFYKQELIEFALFTDSASANKPLVSFLPPSLSMTEPDSLSERPPWPPLAPPSRRRHRQASERWVARTGAHSHTLPPHALPPRPLHPTLAALPTILPRRWQPNPLLGVRGAPHEGQRDPARIGR